MILVGNKCDMKDQRRVFQDQAKELAQKNNGMKYYDVSAKENININDVFEEIMNQVYQIKNLGTQEPMRQTIKL